MKLGTGPSKPLVVLVTALLGTTALHAQIWEDKWKVQASASLLTLASDPTRIEPPDLRADHDTSGEGLALGISLEYAFSPRFSLEIGAQIGEFDNELTGVGASAGLRETRSMSTYAWLVGFDWHPFASRDSRVDWTLGPFVTQGNFSDVTFFAGTTRETKLRFDDDLGFGLKVGADIPLGDAWFLNTELRASALLLESERAGEDLDLDPVSVAVGLGYRF